MEDSEELLQPTLAGCEAASGSLLLVEPHRLSVVGSSPGKPDINLVVLLGSEVACFGCFPTDQWWDDAPLLGPWPGT